jgi:DNA-binding MarR family transcriptional regulator
MNRIYIRHIELLTNSDTRSRVFLAYMKIRNTSKARCGGFSLQDLIKSLSVSDTTARKTLKRLIEFGYITKLKDNYYRTISFKTITGNNLHEKFFKLSNEDLFSYNWTNISSFRALLVELHNQSNRNKRKSLRKGFTVVTRDGVREKISSPSKKELDTLMATTYVSTYTNKHFSTISKYRRKQSLVKYSIEKPIIVKMESKADENFTGLDTNMLGKKIGKYLTYRKYLLFVPVSTRFGNVKLNGY